MLACVVPDMSTQKRRGSLFTWDQPGLPVTKRAREQRSSNQKSTDSMGKLRQPVPLFMYCSPSHTRRIPDIRARIGAPPLLKNVPTFVEVCQKITKKKKGEEIKDIEGENGVRKKKDETKEVMSFNGCKSQSPVSLLSSFEDEFPASKVPPKLKQSPTLLTSPVAHSCKKSLVNSRPTTQRNNGESSWYVKRMASLNARACVSVLMESTRRTSKAKKGISHEATTPRPITPRPVSPPKENGGIPKPSSPHASNPTPLSLILIQKISSRQSSVDRDDGTSCGFSDYRSYVVACASPTTLERYGIIQTTESTTESEDVPYNTEGLLWNGDTLHPQSRVYLCADGSVPQRIVPPVQPATIASVQKAVCKAKKQHRKNGKKKAMKVIIIYEYKVNKLVSYVYKNRLFNSFLCMLLTNQINILFQTYV